MRRVSILFAALSVSVLSVRADYQIDWHASFQGEAASGTFAPYYLSSRENGVTGASPYAVYTLDGFNRNVDKSKRFSYGFGAEIMAGYVSKIDYQKYNAASGEYVTHGIGPGNVLLQQLYGEIKYRSLFLSAGMKPTDRSLFDSPLAVGDYVLSDNARPVPQVRIGFLDFTDVPFTKGWLQVRGELAYGKFTDNGWIRNQANEKTSFVTTGTWMHHKSWYFRVAPRERFTFTVGLQHAAQFGGTSKQYYNGEVIGELKASSGLKQFAKILLPKQGEGSEYYDGNHLGSWDIKADYRFDFGTLTFSAQFPWEDGSGIGKLNGFDGIWGLGYKASHYGIVDGVILQYIDMTNQSGPIHWAPDDFPGTGITGGATGADDYYNNYFYDGWANYGMGLGTPFLKSPVYNTDGYPRYLDNRVRGFHLGIGGHPAKRWEYRLLVSHRTSWGTLFVPAEHRRHATSWMLQGQWECPATKGLSVNASVGMDTGSLYGDSFGVRVGISYLGILNIKRKR